jgi:hypothetical protein
MARLIFLGSFVVLAAAACNENKPEPATPATPPSAADPAPSKAEPAEPAVKRKPFEIYSNCSDVVSVAFGADPKAPNAGRRTIAPSGSIEGTRDNDGNQVVWLFDDKGEPLIKVNVTRGMKRVEVGKSCRTMDAR